jgi:single-strand DNA-binding protein
MSFEVEGKLIKKYETENKTGTFQAREFVIEVNSGNYPQFVKFQLVQDRCTLLDPYEEGEYIKVHFDLRGREWQGKYFTNLNAWRLEKAVAQQPAAPPPADNSGFPSAEDEPLASSSSSTAPAAAEGDDDLPF